MSIHEQDGDILNKSKAPAKFERRDAGLALAAIAAALAAYTISKCGLCDAGGVHMVADSLSISAQVLGAIVGVVFTVLTLVLNLRAFPIRVIVPRLLDSEEVVVFTFAFGITLILDIIGLAIPVGQTYLTIAGALFAASLVLLVNAVHFILSQLTLEEPLNALAQEYSDSLGH